MWQNPAPLSSNPVFAGELRPEHELLLCCARTHLDPKTADRIKAFVREELDWPYLLQAALRHRVMPLLYWNLNEICPEAVPKTILAQLENHFIANTQRNLLLTRELLNLLRSFFEHEIQIIPFKGPILAASIYSNFALRQCGDLDFLIPPQDVLRAKRLLLSAGFCPLRHLTDTQEKARLETRTDYHSSYENDNVKVELHWQITPRYLAFPIDIEQLWQSLEAMPLADTVLYRLPPERLLLILCTHGAKHQWDRLSWICDIAELIRKYPDINWGWVNVQAKKLGIERILFLGLFLANSLLGTRLPVEIYNRMCADSLVKVLVRQICDHLFNETEDPWKGVEKHIFFLRVRERLQDRISYFLYWSEDKITPNVKDQVFFPLPTYLSFLHYLIRPVRLVKEYRMNPFKYLFGF